MVVSHPCIFWEPNSGPAEASHTLNHRALTCLLLSKLQRREDQGWAEGGEGQSMRNAAMKSITFALS